MKQCFKCKTVKPLNEFYRHTQMSDGHLGKCKRCTKHDVSERYYDPSSRERIIKYESLRFKTQERKVKVAEYQRKMRKKFPGKYRARTKVQNALRSGSLQRLPCEECGDIKSQAHHTDYRKPLSVRWLCRHHHMTEEKKIPFV